jgi:hypothetical protein
MQNQSANTASGKRRADAVRQTPNDCCNFHPKYFISRKLDGSSIWNESVAWMCSLCSVVSNIKCLACSMSTHTRDTSLAAPPT